MIFDAPTSSFGEIKEDLFYNIIDSINKQCIIVTKDLLESLLQERADLMSKKATEPEVFCISYQKG